MQPKQVAERIKDAEIVIINKVLLDHRTAVFSANRLKLICTVATGLTMSTSVAATERNIPVCNVLGYVTHFGMVLKKIRNRSYDIVFKMKTLASWDGGAMKLESKQNLLPVFCAAPASFLILSRLLH